MSRGWAKGSTRRWRTLRRAVLARDGYRCRLALPGTWVTRAGKVQGCGVVASQVHHVHGKGRCAGCSIDAPDHLMAACAPCNQHVGDPGTSKINNRPQPRSMTRW